MIYLFLKQNKAKVLSQRREKGIGILKYSMEIFLNDLFEL